MEKKHGGGGGGGGTTHTHTHNHRCWPDWIILHIQWGSFSSRRRLRYFALLLELKDRSGVVGYTVVIFSAHFVAVKCEVFTTSSTMEIQLCARPATQLTHSPYFRQNTYASPLRMREDLSEKASIRVLRQSPVKPWTRVEQVTFAQSSVS